MYLIWRQNQPRKDIAEPVIPAIDLADLRGERLHSIRSVIAQHHGSVDTVTKLEREHILIDSDNAITTVVVRADRDTVRRGDDDAIVRVDTQSRRLEHTIYIEARCPCALRVDDAPQQVPLSVHERRIGRDGNSTTADTIAVAAVDATPGVVHEVDSVDATVGGGEDGRV